MKCVRVAQEAFQRSEEHCLPLATVSCFDVNFETEKWPFFTERVPLTQMCTLNSKCPGVFGTLGVWNADLTMESPNGLGIPKLPSQRPND